MSVLELIRNADSAADVLAVLAVYLESLRNVAVIPEWCLRLPVEGEPDLYARMLAMISVVNLTSQHLLSRDCNIAKQALRVFAAAAWRLRRHRDSERHTG